MRVLLQSVLRSPFRSSESTATTRGGLASDGAHARNVKKAVWNTGGCAASPARRALLLWRTYLPASMRLFWRAGRRTTRSRGTGRCRPSSWVRVASSAILPWAPIEKMTSCRAARLACKVSSTFHCCGAKADFASGAASRQQHAADRRDDRQLHSLGHKQAVRDPQLLTHLLLLHRINHLQCVACCRNAVCGAPQARRPSLLPVVA